MISVTIYINDRPLYTRTALNRIEATGHYLCDDGSRIKHDPKDGAVVLAKKMLDTVSDIGNQKTLAGRMGTERFSIPSRKKLKEESLCRDCYFIRTNNNDRFMQCDSCKKLDKKLK